MYRGGVANKAFNAFFADVVPKLADLAVPVDGDPGGSLLAPGFRAWPTTYRWGATVALGDRPHMVSRWERTGTERGQSYRSLTGSD